MEFIFQPKGSYCCGQCCVAMAAGVTLEEAIQACGRKGTTSTGRLRDGLKKVGIEARSGKLRPIYGNLAKLPHTCILKVVASGRRSGWHWILKKDKYTYCPIDGLGLISDYAGGSGDKITSYLELYMDGPRTKQGGLK